MKPATATCMAADWCELMLLRRLDFQQLVQNYPDLLTRVIYHATHKDKMGASLNVRANHLRLQAANARRKDKGPQGAEEALLTKQATRGHLAGHHHLGHVHSRSTKHESMRSTEAKPMSAMEA